MNRYNEYTYERGCPALTATNLHVLSLKGLFKMVFTHNHQQTDIKALASAAIKYFVFETAFIENLALKVPLNNRVNDLEKENGDLHKKLDELKQYPRRNSLRVFIILENKNEDTDNLVLDVFNNKLGLKVTPDEVYRSHRIGAFNPSSKRPRGITVKFTSYRYGDLVFRTKKMLKGTGIIIKEGLTRNRLETLNYAVHKFSFKNVCTTDGIIYINKNGKEHTCQTINEFEKLCD
ncbi:hypothetical protein ILUMI_03475 [Ignelater luminosus]|uniref:Uncharacterized protein n=1 Tax=Ignelater luminosus TaxID=2038154 RepID=A0A8K0DEJ2_IGNLU|nr:hypothetical protein ILUMI_03475 [Ignelater luminosus]